MMLFTRTFKNFSKTQTVQVWDGVSTSPSAFGDGSPWSPRGLGPVARAEKSPPLPQQLLPLGPTEL